MNPQGTLLLVRHGHTASNGAGLSVTMSGWTDVPLSSPGRLEATRVAAHIAATRRPAVVYTSPLERARATAQVVCEACNVRLCVEPDLREIHCGEADGLTLRDVQNSYPEHWRRNLAHNDPAFRWPGGESYLELRERSLRALRRIASIHPEECAVIVTHAGVISQIVGTMCGLSAGRWDAHRPRNGSITEVVLSEDSGRVLAFDTLPPPSLDEAEAPESKSPRSAA